RMAAVDGSPHAVATLIETAQLPDRAEILGPVSLDDDTERALVRVPRADAKALASALFTAQAQRVARKDPDPIPIPLDPTHLTQYPAPGVGRVRPGRVARLAGRVARPASMCGAFQPACGAFGPGVWCVGWRCQVSEPSRLGAGMNQQIDGGYGLRRSEC